jgi:predicted lactoylglutathione lyase
MLGFMIATNTTDQEAKAQGIKDVTFVMMLTDDSLQDEWAVACAKAYVYQYELPAHITKAHFVSDGAGCFKSKLHRCIQPFWKHWTGIDEISLRVTPAGDGKSSLDGVFGRTNTVLHSSVDAGSSHYNADTIKEAVELSDGLSATKFLVYGPDRSNQVKAELEGIDCRMTLTTLLDPNRADNDNTSHAYKHSGHGKGILVDPTRKATFFFGTSAKDADRIHGVYTEMVSTLSYLGLMARRRTCSLIFLNMFTSGRNRR